MATATIAPPTRDRVTLLDLDWATYQTLRQNPANDRVRMDYLDGTLTLMSPDYVHDEGAEVLGLLVRGVTAGLGLSVKGIRSTTLRQRDGVQTGSGKEPDNAFYLGENERRMRLRKKGKLDLTLDPPPDLAIEVENSRDAQATLPIYARLGVPELWRYDVQDGQLWFGLLVDGQYFTVDRSGCLPRLTPALVLHALAVLDQGDMDENEWSEWVKDWARGLPEPPVTD